MGIRGRWARSSVGGVGASPHDGPIEGIDFPHQPRGEKFKKDFWTAEVTKMIKVYGAPIEDADVGKIVDYLAANY